MGVYYTQFLKKLNEAYLISSMGIEDFFKSKNVHDIYKEFNIYEDSFLWALNITEFCRQNDLESNKINKRAMEILKEEFKNEDGMF